MTASKKQEDSLYIRDTPVMLSSLVSVVISLLATVLTIVRLRPHAFKVPVQYVQSSKAVLTQADWYFLYSLPLAMILATVFTILIARRIHENNRHMALGILVIANIFGLYCLLASNALFALVAGV